MTASTAHHALLAREEEQALARAIRAGQHASAVLAGDTPIPDDRRAAYEAIASAGKAARERFIASNIRLVHSIARRYSAHGLDADDLAQEGTLGMMHALTKFDPDRGYKFSTYATPWIHQAIRRAIANQSRLIRLPENQAAALAKIARVMPGLAERLGRNPDETAIAEETGLTSEAVALLLPHLRGTLSLHLPVGDDGGTELADLLESGAPDIPDTVADRLRADAIAKALTCLSDTERTVIAARFGLRGSEDPSSLADIARALGVTRERVRQIESRALAKLRHPALLHHHARQDEHAVA